MSRREDLWLRIERIRHRFAMTEHPIDAATMSDAHGRCSAERRWNEDEDEDLRRRGVERD